MSDVATVTIKLDESVAENAPASTLDRLDAFADVSDALNVPASARLRLFCSVELSVAEIVPLSEVASVALTNTDDVSVADSVPESETGTGVLPPIMVTEADSVAEIVPVSE